MGCGIIILLLICYVSKPFNGMISLNLAAVTYLKLNKICFLVIALKCHYCSVESANMCEPSSVQTCPPEFKYCATFSTIGK